MIPDYHLHSSFSEDCDTDIYDLIESAIGCGMDSICITDHYDRDFPPNEENMTFNLDVNYYINEIIKVKSEVSDKIDLRIGIEMGVMPETAASLSNFKNEHPELDFIIASSHVVDGCDPYYPSCFKGKDEKAVYRRYFESILQNVTNCDCFSVYGHLDYILRYGPTKAKNFDFRDYLDIFEPAFKIIIERGQGIEINTGSLYRGMDFFHPHVSLLKLYKEMGGEIITFGSDSHDTKHIGYGFLESAKLVKETGFNYYCTFKDMKPSFIEI